MKRIGLLFPILLLLLNFGYTQKENFDDYIVDSVKIEHPLFEKIFPGVEFIIYTSDITRPATKIIKGRYRSKSYFLPEGINKLYKLFENDKSASLEDKLKVFLLLFYIQRGDSLNFTDFLLSKISKQIDGRDFNYKANYTKNHDTYTIYFIIKRNQIKQFRIFLANIYQTGGSFFISKKK